MIVERFVDCFWTSKCLLCWLEGLKTVWMKFWNDGDQYNNLVPVVRWLVTDYSIIFTLLSVHCVGLYISCMIDRAVISPVIESWIYGWRTVRKQGYSPLSSMRGTSFAGYDTKYELALLLHSLQHHHWVTLLKLQALPGSPWWRVVRLYNRYVNQSHQKILIIHCYKTDNIVVLCNSEQKITTI